MFFAVTLLSFLFFFQKVQEKLFLDSRKLVEIKHKIMKKEKGLQENLCSFSQELESFSCQLRLYLKHKGNWKSFCQFPEEVLLMRRRRYHLLSLRCSIFSEFLDQELLFLL